MTKQTSLNLMTTHKPFIYKQPGMTAKQTFGLKWESWAAQELSQRGWLVDTPNNFSSEYDLTISTQDNPFRLPVEIKAAQVSQRYVRPGYFRPRYQFCLGNPKTFERLLILIALSQKTGQIVPFIVPNFDLGERSHVALTSHPENYKGRLLTPYRGAWEQVGRTYQIARKYDSVRAGQLSIFDL